jgi:lipopolysaccharide export system protein LptA
MSIPKQLLVLAFLLALLVMPSTSFAADTKAAEEAKPATPIQIEADYMLSNQKENSVFFSGKVEAEQDKVVIHSDEMTVYYADTDAKDKSKVKAGAENSRSIQRIWAVGHVEITKEDWVATGDTAEYFEDERKVVLVGNTKVWQNNNLITGDTFIMYLDEGKSIVERSSKKDERVKAFFYPDAEDKKE